MQKAIVLEVTLKAPPGQSPDAVQALVAGTLAGEHAGLTIQVGGVQAGAPGTIRVVLGVQGDRPAPENFTQATTDLVHQLWHAQTGLEAARPELMRVAEMEDYDSLETGGLESAGLEAAGGHHRRCIGHPTPGGAPVGAGLHTLPADAARPAPQAAMFDECPPDGEQGGDLGTNLRKNRIDSAHWRAATVSAIIALNAQIPPNLPHRRTAWKADHIKAIGRYEGLPLQVMGYLAGVAEENGEACNCHSLSDYDFHSWLVDAPGKDRKESVVIELSPRVRAQHPGWTFERVCMLVANAGEVRISGWLMLDPEHPSEVGKSRGTIWELHPVMQIEVRQHNTWVPLDTADLGGLEAALPIEFVDSP